MKPAVVLFVLIGLLTPSFAQQPPAQQPAAQAPDISVNVDRKQLNFTVSDGKGKLITTLKKEDFRVFEDEKLQAITNFSSETNLPLTVSLIIDSSGSIRDKLRFEQEAATVFFHETLSRGKDKGSVWDFDTQAEVLQSFTDDADKLQDAIRKIRSGGGTAMYDALYLAITDKEHGLSRQDGRKVIILIGDGDDNNSRLSMTEMLEAAQKHDVAIYAISTNKTAEFNSKQAQGDKTMRKISEDTGGRVFFPLKIENLTENFQAIAQELRAQYSLAYSPTNSKADGTFRRIRVEVLDKKYKAKTPNGYYASRPVKTSSN